jgi:hypothetical protein
VEKIHQSIQPHIIGKTGIKNESDDDEAGLYQQVEEATNAYSENIFDLFLTSEKAVWVLLKFWLTSLDVYTSQWCAIICSMNI